MKNGKFIVIIYIAILILAIVGEVKCIIKSVNCNWEPIGKAEVVYTASALTGAGCVVGWININDN